MAKAGKGEAEFVASGTRLEPKVLKQLQRALQPILKNVRVEWGESLQSKIKQSPPVLPPLFEGERLIFYALVDKSVQLDDLKFANVQIKAETADSDSTEIVFPLKFDEGDSLLEKDKSVAHRLAASGLIKHLSTDKELSKKNKDEITRLGIKYSIASEHTSFVAVNERSEAVGATMATVDTNSAILDNITEGGGGALAGKAMFLDSDGDDDVSNWEADEEGVALDMADLRSYAQDVSKADKQELRQASKNSASSSLFGSVLGGIKDAVSSWSSPSPIESNRLPPSPITPTAGFSFGTASGGAAPSPQQPSVQPGYPLMGAVPPPSMYPAPPPQSGYPPMVPTSYPYATVPSGGVAYGAPPPSMPPSVYPSSTSTSTTAVPHEPASQRSSSPSLARRRMSASSSSPAPAPESDKAVFKKSLNAEDERSKRREQTVSIRKDKRDQKLEKKRAEREHEEERERKPSAAAGERKRMEEEVVHRESERAKRQQMEVEERLRMKEEIQRLEREADFMASESLDWGDDLPDINLSAQLDQRQQQPQQHQLQQLQQLQHQQQPKLVTNAHMRPLDRVVQLQQFNGSWVLCQDLVELFKAKTVEAVKAAKPESLKSAEESETLWTTALAIALLEFAFADAKEEWKMLAGKATKWLKLQLKKASVPYDSLIEQATVSIKAWAA